MTQQAQPATPQPIRYRPRFNFLSPRRTVMSDEWNAALLDIKIEKSNISPLLALGTVLFMWMSFYYFQRPAEFEYVAEFIVASIMHVVDDTEMATGTAVVAPPKLASQPPKIPATPADSENTAESKQPAPTERKENSTPAQPEKSAPPDTVTVTAKAEPPKLSPTPDAQKDATIKAPSSGYRIRYALCFLPKSAEDVVAELKPKGVKGEIVTASEERAVFKVVFGPYDLESSAKKVVDELKSAHGIDSSYFTGDNSFFVTTDYYSAKHSAESALKKALAAGYKGSIRESKQIIKVYRVLGASFAEKSEATAELKKLKSKGIEAFAEKY